MSDATTESTPAVPAAPKQEREKIVITEPVKLPKAAEPESTESTKPE